MKNDEINKGNNSVGKEDILDRLPQSQIPWKRSREDVWGSLQDRLAEKHEARTISLSSYVLRLSAAAVIILMIGTVTFMRLYTRTVSTDPGQISSLMLPKGSEVMLNAGTTLKYKPLWWTFKRKLILDGEAYFDVSSGNEFRVISESGTTSVLGTSFNIYSRTGEYEVDCYTGRVKVASLMSGKEVILQPNQKVVLDNQGEPSISEESSVTTYRNWRNGYFNFTSAPVTRVFDEIARQYGITVKGTENLDLIYTGNFAKEQPVNEVMNLVCKAFGIDFVVEGQNTYRVISNAN